MSELATKTCVPCHGGVPPLKGEQLASLAKQVDGWEVVDEHHIVKRFQFPNCFCQVLGLRQNFLFQIRVVGDKGIQRADPLYRSIQLAEEFLRDAGSDFGPESP